MPLLGTACVAIGPEAHDARWDLDGDGLQRPADCDDGDAAVQRLRWFHDSDRDGHGDPDRSQVSCAPPPSGSPLGDDCDDDRADVHPGAPELCDARDNDCDGDTDEELVELPWYRDADGDRYGDPDVVIEDCAPPEGYLADGTDCDDGDDAVHPDAGERCNGIDDDCDRAVDFEDADLDPDGYLWYLDGDGDGYAPDDAVEVEACEPPDDHVGDRGDCDDENPDLNPGELEVCDAFDNDCNGRSNGPDATDARDWFEDADRDGYGNPASQKTECEQPIPGNWVLADPVTDCDDTRADIHPGVDECCADGEDDDCDTYVDEYPCVPADSGATP